MRREMQKAVISCRHAGLGEAGMYFDGAALRPFAGEGGHASFAPEGEVQAELFEYLMRKFGHVSCERVLSGPGLVNIYEFLFRDTGRGPESPAVVEKMRTGDPAAAISEAALADASGAFTMKPLKFLRRFTARRLATWR